MQKSIPIRQNNNICRKQKLKRYCFQYSSSWKLYQLLNLQIDVEFISRLNLSTLYCLESRKHYVKVACVCMFIFVFLLRRETLTNLGMRVKKSKIITTSNNCIAICSLQALRFAISFNPQDNLVRLVLLAPLCRGGNSG